MENNPEFAKVLSMKDVSEINRALGVLEGLSYGVDGVVSEGILDAVGMIDDVLRLED